MATFFGEVLPVISRAIEDDDDDDELDFVETYRNIITNHRDFLPPTSSSSSISVFPPLQSRSTLCIHHQF